MREISGECNEAGVLIYNKWKVPKARRCNTGLPRAALNENSTTVGVGFGRQSKDGVRRYTRKSLREEKK
jgi:hypothetical protein